MLEAVQLTKRYESGAGTPGGILALDSLTLAVATGELFCLLGDAGAGKTTAIHLFLGYTRPTSGCARICGINVDDDTLTARARLAYIPSQMNLYPAMSGLENLGYFAELAGRPGCARRELAGFLKQAGLSEEAIGQPVATYSSEMRQAVGLALARAKRAEALLLDEPTKHLDDCTSRGFLERVQALAEGGMAVLLATADPAHAEFATRTGVLLQGRLEGERVPAGVH